MSERRLLLHLFPVCFKKLRSLLTGSFGHCRRRSYVGTARLRARVVASGS
jgi:hypothetical protein